MLADLGALTALPLDLTEGRVITWPIYCSLKKTDLSKSSLVNITVAVIWTPEYEKVAALPKRQMTFLTFVCISCLASQV